MKAMVRAFAAILLSGFLSAQTAAPKGGEDAIALFKVGE
jgi:hypothetical protein